MFDAFEGQSAEMTFFMITVMTIGLFAIVMAITELIRSAYQGHINKTILPYKQQVKDLQRELARSRRANADLRKRYEAPQMIEDREAEQEFQRIRNELIARAFPKRKVTKRTSNAPDCV